MLASPVVMSVVPLRGHALLNLAGGPIIAAFLLLSRRSRTDGAGPVPAP